MADEFGSSSRSQFGELRAASLRVVARARRADGPSGSS